MQHIIDPAFPVAFQKSEQFRSFCAFTESYITSLDNRRLRFVLRNKSEARVNDILSQLAYQIAVEAYLRAREMTGSHQDNMLIQLGVICTDIDLFIEDIDFID